jgi:hypothetical protein
LLKIREEEKNKEKQTTIFLMQYKKRRERRKRSNVSPLLDLCYQQGLLSIHTICVCNLSLVDHLSWIMCNQANRCSTSKLYPHAAGNYTQVCKGK